MRPINGNASAPKLSLWHSPVPYLFGGLAFILGLIAFALLILLCSYRKNSGESEEQQSEKPANSIETLSPLDMEPKFVVIMAGEQTPTFLAKPSTHDQE
ncbi:hypothetical protein AMTRI_Chr10g6710 [Amborella trichopoda]|uniref:Uncharacterized protein n=1 Tax=Amborella trichopoda TaxID=13333 RepID=W1P7J2_AMBTC|nr:hypothetical protein AMTR_s00006p00263100 [Amborella trichopoda]